MTPIKTIIRNKKPVAKAVNYIGKSPVWLPANGEATVDFEIWSVADDSQKTAIKTLCEAGAIELTVMVLGVDGEYTVTNFDPTGGKKRPVIKAPEAEKPAMFDTTKNMVQEKDHIVKVGGAETKQTLESMGAKPIGFKDEEILPVREVKNGEPEKKEASVKDEATVSTEDNAGGTAAADSSETGAKKASRKKGTKQEA